jgi:hypothetical protein
MREFTVRFIRVGDGGHGVSSLNRGLWCATFTACPRRRAIAIACASVRSRRERQGGDAANSTWAVGLTQGSFRGSSMVSWSAGARVGTRPGCAVVRLVVEDEPPTREGVRGLGPQIQVVCVSATPRIWFAELACEPDVIVRACRANRDVLVTGASVCEPLLRRSSGRACHTNRG